MDDGAFLGATEGVATCSSMGCPAFCSKHKAHLCILFPLREVYVELGSTCSFSLKYLAAHASALGQDDKTKPYISHGLVHY